MKVISQELSCKQLYYNIELLINNVLIEMAIVRTVMDGIEDIKLIEAVGDCIFNVLSVEQQKEVIAFLYELNLDEIQ